MEHSCDMCGGAIDPHGHYIVRMEVFADPSMPAVSGQELAEGNLDDEMEKLLAQMEGMTAEELQDQVYRKMEFRVCRRCQQRILANPLGRPRRLVAGEN